MLRLLPMQPRRGAPEEWRRYGYKASKIGVRGGTLSSQGQKVGLIPDAVGSHQGIFGLEVT